METDAERNSPEFARLLAERLKYANKWRRDRTGKLEMPDTAQHGVDIDDAVDIIGRFAGVTEYLINYKCTEVSDFILKCALLNIIGYKHE